MNLKNALLIVILSSSSDIFSLEESLRARPDLGDITLQTFLQQSTTPPPRYSPPPTYAEPTTNAYDILPSYAQAVAHTRRVKKSDYIILAATGLLSLWVTGGGIYFFRTSGSDTPDAELPLIAGIAVGAGSFGIGLSILGTYIKCVGQCRRINQMNALMSSELYAHTV